MATVCACLLDAGVRNSRKPCSQTACGLCAPRSSRVVCGATSSCTVLCRWPSAEMRRPPCVAAKGRYLAIRVLAV